MSRRGIRRGKVKEPEQFAISQPTVIDLFDKLSTRSGGLYPRSPHVVKPLRTTRQRPASVGVPKDMHLASPLSSPVRTTSTEALDTEEGEEVTKYLTESVIKRQRRASVSIMQDTEEYENDLPQPSTVPIPLPWKQDKDPKDRSASVQIDTSWSIYEVLDITSHLSSQTPRYFEQTQEVHEGLSDTVKKAPLPSASSAFVHYSHSVLDILHRRTRQTPLGMWRTYSETLIPPLVYGKTPEGSSDEKGKTKSQTTLGGGDVPILLENSTMTLPIMTTGASFVVTKEPLTQFTQTIQGDTVVTVTAVSLVTDRVKTVDTQKSIDPDFYLPHGLQLSDTQQYKCTDLSPEGNLAVIVKLPNLKDKYGVDLFLLDRKSGHLYVPNQNGIYSIIEEKGWIYPTESMMIDPVAGNLSVSGNVTPQTLHLTGINPTPDAESTRDSIRHGPKRPPKTVRELLNKKGGTLLQQVQAIKVLIKLWP